MYRMVTNIYFMYKILFPIFFKNCEITIDYSGYQIIGIQDKIK